MIQQFSISTVILAPNNLGRLLRDLCTRQGLYNQNLHYPCTRYNIIQLLQTWLPLTSLLHAIYDLFGTCRRPPYIDLVIAPYGFNIHLYFPVLPQSMVTFLTY